ncbi:2-succinyl-5-enolpyruvyl-6-hydroxy-3-cyclohexene-1-carboxylic-acid synthase [Phytoactinopolyspora mesophila]|uniref:2-succinyl-5-enolpyruvyl-6-hydroxy-3-cyclohexene-1-carboxylate synthase n=1 Tax=Phytoactinopolyspora mesophila TaxID=2650750 RepID=A0A7K3M310_9ACTN|nr:2-succinyl-5-enolpyruvyl-6-hydroxy-3-cyclohexene-1-carboxylic-acid synthase [Phytoactinopolyspora mesophila]
MNPSTAVAEAIVDELVRHGVEHAVLAPGSRSAPLAFAFAAAADRGHLRLHVRIDERSAAFTALGLARVSGPVAVATTSGTAVANLHPAVLEAAHSNVPLILLTADRPHEMRGTGANQTTDQVAIFGSAVRYFADVPAPYGRPDEVADMRSLLARALAACAGSRGGAPGPAHLNLSFREPLVPDPGSAAASWVSSESSPHGRTAVHAVHPPRPGQPDPSAPGSALALPWGPRTAVIAGDGAGFAARDFAERGGFPLLAEPSSGARSGPNALGPYRLLLSRPELGGQIERVVVFGRPTLSRPVSALLARRDVEVVVVAAGDGWPDAARNAAHVTHAVHMARHDHPGEAGNGWLAAWQEADHIARRAIDGVLDTGTLNGPLVAREVWAALRDGEALVVASSNPIRDVDLTAAPFAGDAESQAGPLVLANRGLAGIDGTLSTAAGVGLASGRLTRVLVGDLAFLHDAGGLLVGPSEDTPDMQIVVLNDSGGGIFSLLEQGAPEYAKPFERVFGTPHAADLAALCAGYGLAHVRVDDVAQLRAELAEPRSGRTVVEVRVDRNALRDLHARLRDAVTHH